MESAGGLVCMVVSNPDISKMQANELEAALKAVLERYSELFPEWEMNIVTVDKTKDKNTQIDRMVELLQKMKTSP